MNTITEINTDMLDLVSGGASSFASTVDIAADGTVSGTYTLGDRSGSFSSKLSIPVYKAGTVSITASAGSVSLDSSFAA
jgi:hypothetical protein